MKSNSFFNVLIALVLFHSILAFADVRYVSKTGTSTPPFMSWETASDSLQKCVDICDNGDTVFVANGTYYESVIVSKKIYLIGMSMDSTIIDGRGKFDLTLSSAQSIPLNIQNFVIIGKGGSNTVAVFSRSILNISYCRISNALSGIFSEGGYLNNLFINSVRSGIQGGCAYDTCHYYIENNIILLTLNEGNAIQNNTGGIYRIRNNILLNYGTITTSANAIWFEWVKSAEVTNNIISGYSFGILAPHTNLSNSIYIANNNFIYKGTGLFITNLQAIKNNLFVYKSGSGIFSMGNEWLNEDYNLFWSNYWNYRSNGGPIIPGDSDFVAYPMFVNDKKPDNALDFDFHLQKYSPAIDRGDPNILDSDGSRSDIGAYGGPYASTYVYQDLAPLQPKNLTAVVSSGQIKTKWRKNPEADTSFYSVYMDTVINFTIDSTKLLGNTSDTLFTFSSAMVNKAYYFKVTATDKQGNQSLPSEELRVFISSADTDELKIISSYQLYHNYPNPFNPSTTLSYKLKERGNVNLQVYDIKGEMLKVLVNKEQEAGYYETIFDATGLASGTYIYKIEVTGNGNIPVYTEMKKCILVK